MRELRITRRRDERGNALVEAVIILPILMLLTFGGIELGIGFGQKGALESSTRAGARTASTLTGATENVNNTQIGITTASAVNAALDSTAVPKLNKLWVYRSDQDPDLCAQDCISFVPSAADPKHFNLANPSGSWPLTDRQGCGLTPDRVSVKIQGTFQFLTNLVGGGGNVTLTSTTTLQFEPTNC